MAIYRLEKKSISRGKGHNLVAAVAYRAGLKIADNNPKNDDAKTHDYSKKSDVAHSEIILPDDLKSAGVELTFAQVANLVEQNETTKRGKMKKSAKLASEYVLAGSHELSQAENIQAFREFAEQQSREQGVIAMVFVHDPKQGNDVRASKGAGDTTRHHDPRNIHAHVVVLSRQADLTATGRLALGSKSDSELSDTARADKGLPPSRVWLKQVRESWADIQNASLARHNLAPITHKSYKDLGLDIKPTKHMGKDAKALESAGIQTHIGTHNREVAQHNDTIIKQSTDSAIDSAEQAVNRASTAINRATRPRPTPFDPQQWRVRADDERDTETDDIDEQTERFNSVAEQAHRNAGWREPELVSISSTARTLAERDGTMLAGRHYDPRYSDAQRKWLDGFAGNYGLHTGDIRQDIVKASAFFDNPHNATAHRGVIALIRHPEQHPITADTPRPNPTPQAEPTPTPQAEPYQRPKPR